MKMKSVAIKNTGLLEINIFDLPKSCVLIISEGQVKLSELPAYAETKIITNQGKVKRVKWDEGEEF